jgi:O-antigen biosynthesis protein WbqV
MSSAGLPSLFRLHRGYIAFAHDMVMAGLSILLSLWLRLGDSLWATWEPARLAQMVGLFVAVAAPVLLSQRLYRGIWRYVSTQELAALVRAVTLTIVIFMLVLFLWTRGADFPRSLMAINWFVLLGLLGGPRFLYRILRDRRTAAVPLPEGARAIPVLLAGDGDGADQFLRAIHRGDAHYQALGILSRRDARVGRDIHNVAVLGRIDQLDEVVASLKKAGTAPERVIIVDDSLSGATLRQLLDQADALGLSLARIPRLTDLKDGLADQLQVKPIAVEDLLGRPQAVLDRQAMASLIAGRRVLVTGAGGSIGGELVRQIAEAGPAGLTLLESSEFALYTIDMEMSERYASVPRRAVLGDVRDKARIAQIFAETRPELVFHAAALKHVPMVEANPLEGLMTNAVGTRIVADASRDAGVALMVLISTDKAVNPTNVMGATKRVAESYLQALDSAAVGSTSYVTVRFGNVLGSTGSVVPLFQRQLAAGGPLTVTDPEMTRYFMTIREAVELVLQASAFRFHHPELHRGRIFVLDMGEPVKIVHLARQMIRLAGLKPDIDVKIQFTGLRPGEKLFEEIFHGSEAPVPTEMDGILEATVRAGDLASLAEALDHIQDAGLGHDEKAGLALIRRLVPEYGIVSPSGA